MSDYQQQALQENDIALDAMYKEIQENPERIVCSTCMNDDHLINTAGYWYCTKCTNDEITLI